MWKIFNMKKNGTSASSALRVRLNADMDYLGLDVDIQKGFLFFLGASLNVGFNKVGIDLSKYKKNESDYVKNLIKTIDAYSKATGIFSDYGQLNDYVFTSYIYSINFIFHNILAKSNIDDQLREIKLREDADPIKIWKTDLINDFVKPYIDYSDSQFKLNDYHNLIELFFKKIGQHLTETGFDKTKSYEAGYAYFSKQYQLDMKGTKYMFETIYSFLTPMYMALYNYPMLQLFYPKEFDANHIFSNTLQMFYGGIDPKIIQPIHRYHQHEFYSELNWRFSLEKTSANFPLPFSLKDYVDIQTTILHYASRIKESGLVDNKTIFIDSRELFNKELIDFKIEINEFYYEMFDVVFEKHHIDPTNGEGSWNNLGGFIQYCAVLFYETCIHAVVIGELTENPADSS